MFSTKLTRVAHRTPPAAALNTQSSTVTAHFSAPCVADRRQHQRRHSSSKAAYPPNSAAGSGKSTAAAKDAPVTPATADASSLSGTPAPARPKRAYKARKLRASSMSKAGNQFAGLPSVESTKAWRYNDFAVSSFFSLHRPLSLVVPVPRPSSAEEFASIFESRNDAWHNGNSAEGRPEDMVYALHPFFQETSLSSFGSQEGAFGEDGQDSILSFDDAKHLDGGSNGKAFDDMMGRFQHIPFRAPPPPQPFVAEKPVSSKKRRDREALKEKTMKVLNGLKTAERTFQTLLTMTEATSQDGQKFYIAERGPIVELEASEARPIEEQSTSRSRSQSLRMRSTRQPAASYALPNRPRQSAADGSRVFTQTVVQRYIRRSPTKRPEMVFISVKRQRKLKMKKHKYKKLMKKTRTLRRKLDRQ